MAAPGWQMILPNVAERIVLVRHYYFCRLFRHFVVVGLGRLLLLASQNVALLLFGFRGGAFSGGD